VVPGWDNTFARMGSTWYAAGANMAGQLGLPSVSAIHAFTEIPGTWTQIIPLSGETYAMADKTLYRNFIQPLPGIWDEAQAGARHLIVKGKIDERLL